jgi:aminopeptidase N
MLKSRTRVVFLIAVALIVQAAVPLSRARNFEPAHVSHREPEGTEHPHSPRTYDVLNYTIRTSFDIPNKAVIGEETLTFKPLRPEFKSLVLDASDMNVETVSLAASTDVSLQWTQPPDKLAITMDRAYQPSDSVTLRIHYRATPHRGLYFVPASPAAAGQRYKPAQIWTQGEPEDNHHWFPCYDFPDEKATSEQYITTRSNQIAISNGSLLENTANPDGTHTFHWKMNRPHASYLISMVVGDYVKISDSYKGIPVEYYTYRGSETETRRAFLKTPQMMKWFSQTLNYEYPYDKYSQTLVSYFFFGGMENITATTQSDSDILSGGESPDSVDNLVSHELAHQWFGDLVTCKDWSHAWLNEGLATFMEASFKEHEGGRASYLKELQSDVRLYLAEDELSYRRPLVFNRYRTPIDLFDSTLYKKGAFVMHMLRETVGDELFWKSLNRYLTENQYKDVETRDLERAFEQTTAQQLDWFFDQWVYKAGYPELHVTHTYDPASKQLTLNVEQTQTPEINTPAVFRLPLDVEISTHAGAKTEKVEMTQRKQQFTFAVNEKPAGIAIDKDLKILKTLEIQS